MQHPLQIDTLPQSSISKLEAKYETNIKSEIEAKFNSETIDEKQVVAFFCWLNSKERVLRLKDPL